MSFLGLILDNCLITVVPQFPQRIGSWTPANTKIADAPVPYVNGIAKLALRIRGFHVCGYGGLTVLRLKFGAEKKKHNYVLENLLSNRKYRGEKRLPSLFVLVLTKPSSSGCVLSLRHSDV